MCRIKKRPLHETTLMELSHYDPLTLFQCGRQTSCASPLSSSQEEQAVAEVEKLHMKEFQL